MTPQKKLQRAASSFVEALAKAGGGSVSINGQEIVRVPGPGVLCPRCGSVIPEDRACSCEAPAD